MPRALICDPDRHAMETLGSILKEIGMKVETMPTGHRSIGEMLGTRNFDIIFIPIPPDASTLTEMLGGLAGHNPSRVILTGSSVTPDIIREASTAGIAYFLGKPFRKPDVIAGIELAVAHSEQVEGYREEISRLKDLLEQRKNIERAKGILMEKRALGEAEAYRLMQTTAMKQRITLREVAERILKGMTP